MAEHSDLGASRPLVRPKKRVPLAQGEKLADRIMRQVEPETAYILVTGSIRRRRPEIADIDFVVLPKDVEAFVRMLAGKGYAGGNRHRVRYVDGIKVEFHIAHKPDELGAHVFMYTGDWLFNVAMRSLAKRRGWKLDQYGLWDRGNNEAILQSPDEEDFFGALGVDYHTPEERSFTQRPRAHSRKKPSMGAELGPQDWTPERSRAIPGQRNAFIEQRADWDGKPWREPDKVEGQKSVWYGPGGPEGDYAATLEWQGGWGWEISDYQPHPEGKILQSKFTLSPEMLSDALWVVKGEKVSPEQLQEDPSLYTEEAISLGIALLGYYGPDDEWEIVEELP